MKFVEFLELNESVIKEEIEKVGSITVRSYGDQYELYVDRDKVDKLTSFLEKSKIEYIKVKKDIGSFLLKLKNIASFDEIKNTIYTFNKTANRVL